MLACLYSLSSWAARPLLCVIQPDREADVGSPVIGIVESVRAERGDMVRKGQILARLRSQVEAASLQVARARAQADADVRAASANYLYLKQEFIRAEELFEQKFISKAALEKSRAEAKIAAEKLAQASRQLDVAKREVELAKAQLELRAIRAPFSGLIVDRHVTVGERIEDQPMFRIARVDPLRVEVVVPAEMFRTVTDDMIARVTPALPQSSAVDAKIVLVDRFIDAASNTFRVRASMPNSDGAIPFGSRCTAELIRASGSTKDGVKKGTVSAPDDPSLVRKLQVDLGLEPDKPAAREGERK